MLYGLYSSTQYCHLQFIISGSKTKHYKNKPTNKREISLFSTAGGGSEGLEDHV